MRNIHPVVIERHRGILLIPAPMTEIYLNPIERTLYRLFLRHPGGILSDQLLTYWQELCSIYAEESCYDDKSLRDNAIESLCAESKSVFYTNISRIKKKFVEALGRRKASPYIIQRGKDGLYRTRAHLNALPPSTTT